MTRFLFFPRLKFRKTFQKTALQLVPNYKLSRPATPSINDFTDYSSPACYAHLLGLREGFKD